ncbi:putative ascorbate-specific transmembrane electron transporter 1 [Tasmannia lanceolata]|uniref:putative ascorbate-specific transmembrane electron transporter 1 n=1 Tax=Tasmannia lanceolata TaxID=3420 RepID=UPI004062DB65
MAIITRHRIQFSSSRSAVFAHLFGLIAAILMLVWIFHFSGGIDLNSENTNLIFNVHPFLMFLGFILVAGQAIMAYKTIWADKRTQKLFHAVLHLSALMMGIIGVYAVFKYHRKNQIPNLRSLHSWLGLGTICTFGLQWVFGFLFFAFPRGSRETRARVLPLHAFGGLLIFLLAICTAETGLVEKSAFSKITNGSQARVLNFTGLFILLYGVAVAFTALLPI